MKQRTDVSTFGVYIGVAKTVGETYPLLFPFTLCSENVISFSCSSIPSSEATLHRSSSVVHWEFREPMAVLEVLQCVPS
jgi:hypothetical protein